MAKNPNDILKEIASETKAAETPPDFVEVGGVKYYRDAQTAAANNRTKKLYRYPRPMKDRPAEEVIEVETIAIAVAPYADRITLDGVQYMAGAVYDFPLPQAAVIREVIQRTWQHEASTGGAYSYGTSAGVRRGSDAGVGGGIRFAG